MSVDSGDHLKSFSGQFTLDAVVDLCDCGANLGKEDIFISQLDNGKPRKYGPNYAGSLPNRLSEYRGWARLQDPNLPADVRVTADERTIIEVMTLNESKASFDAVQSTDSEVLTLGAIQKTIKTEEGAGELNQQLFDFKTQHPTLFQCLIGNCGWDVGPDKHVTYTAPARNGQPAGTPLKAGAALRAKVREANNTQPKNGHNPVIDCFIRLARQPEYQDLQMSDIVKRLREDVLGIYPVSPKGVKYPYPIKDYLRNRVGLAIALDESVKLPAHPRRVLGAAIAQLLVNRPALVGTDPATWTLADERALIQLYADYRGTYSAGPVKPMEARLNITRLKGIRDGFAALGEPVDWLKVPEQQPAKRKKK